MPEVSIVVPVHNDAATLAEVCSRLHQTLLTSDTSHEIVLVDDGSSDDTWAVIQALAAGDATIRPLRLVPNRGQTMAWCAGFEAASGNVLVTMDADLDTHPEDVPLLLAALARGARVAHGRRIGARKPARAVPSLLFNVWFRSLGLPYHDIGCGLMAVDRATARALVSVDPSKLDGYRFKVELARLRPDLVEVRVRCGPPSPSSYRPVPLFLSGVDAGVVAGSRVLPRLSSVGAVGLAGGLVLARRRRWSAVGVGGAGAGCIVARIVLGVGLRRRGSHQQVAAAVPER